VSCCQFHLLFYSSRPLANTFAAICINVALAYWIQSSIPVRTKEHGRVSDNSTSSDGKPTAVDVAASTVAEPTQTISERDRAAGLCVAWLAVACIIFRCDMVLLSACVIVASFIYGCLPFGICLRYGVMTSILSIVSSILIDSYYWRRWLWPELDVLLFNTIRPDPNSGRMFGASEAWGTEPFGWYFLKALPKALMAALPLALIAIIQSKPHANDQHQQSQGKQKNRSRLAVFGLEVDMDVLRLLLPIVTFIFLYSFLPHKELRFIYPILPFCTGLAGVGLRRLQRQYECSRGWFPALLYRGARFGLLLSFCVSVFGLVVSARNYPGGEAFHAFHQLAQAECMNANMHRAVSPLPSSSTSPSSASVMSHPASDSLLPLVHITNLAAISGVSRFGQHDYDPSESSSSSSPHDVCAFRYSKQEGKIDWTHGATKFDYRIAEWEDDRTGYELMWPVNADENRKSARSSPPSPSSSSGPSPIIYAFDRVRLNRSFPFVSIEMKPALVLLRRIRDEHLPANADGS